LPSTRLLPIALALALTASLFVGADSSAKGASDGPSIQSPRVERSNTPTYVDTPTPLFSWLIASRVNGTRQTGYRIVVTHEGKPVWDSGDVPSPQSFDIDYARSKHSLGDCPK